MVFKNEWSCRWGWAVLGVSMVLAGCGGGSGAGDGGSGASSGLGAGGSGIGGSSGAGGSEAGGSGASSGTGASAGGTGGGAGGSGGQGGGLSLAAVAGKALFNDKSLSASGKQSCATCHVAARAFTADPVTDHGLPVPLGGPNMDIPGFRNTPSLVYASLTPGFFLDGGTPTGGFFRDGRASSLDVQAQLPFITPFEMANQGAAEVVGRLQQSPASLQAFSAAYGSQVLGDPRVDLDEQCERRRVLHQIGRRFDRNQSDNKSDLAGG